MGPTVSEKEGRKHLYRLIILVASTCRRARRTSIAAVVARKHMRMRPRFDVASAALQHTPRFNVARFRELSVTHCRHLTSSDSQAATGKGEGEEHD